MTNFWSLVLVVCRSPKKNLPAGSYLCDVGEDKSTLVPMINSANSVGGELSTCFLVVHSVSECIPFHYTYSYFDKRIPCHCCLENILLLWVAAAAPIFMNLPWFLYPWQSIANQSLLRIHSFFCNVSGHICPFLIHTWKHSRYVAQSVSNLLSACFRVRGRPS